MMCRARYVLGERTSIAKREGMGHGGVGDSEEENFRYPISDI
jgi:hypothetical protein